MEAILKSSNFYFRMAFVLGAIYFAFCILKILHPSILILLPFLIAIPGVLIIATPYIKKFWQTKIGKCTIFFMGSVLADISWAIAENMVHAVVKVDPANFKLTVSLLSIAIIPFVWTLAFSLGFSITIITCLLFSLVLALPDLIFPGMRLFSNKLKLDFWYQKKRTLEFKLYGFIFGCFAILFILFEGVDWVENNKNIFHLPISYIITFLNYYDNSECNNVGKNDLFAYLNDGNISIARRDNLNRIYAFDSSKCVLSNNK